MGKRNALGKTMEEIMDAKEKEFIAGAPGWKISVDKMYEKWQKAEESLASYRTAYEEELALRQQDQAQHRQQLRTLSTKAGAARRRMCVGLFCWWLCGMILGIMALITPLDPFDKWLQISLGVAVMLTSAWLWTIIYTHETFAETAARREHENDYHD